jgi:hypothetical protein
MKENLWFHTHVVKYLLALWYDGIPVLNLFILDTWYMRVSIMSIFYLLCRRKSLFNHYSLNLEVSV